MAGCNGGGFEPFEQIIKSLTFKAVNHKSTFRLKAVFTLLATLNNTRTTILPMVSRLANANMGLKPSLLTEH